MGQIRVCWLLSALLPILLFANRAAAVVIYKRGTNKPVTGHLVRQSDREVVVREDTAAGSKETVVPRSEIEDLIESVSPARLAPLNPARPQEYREYAEELAEKKLDPEARIAAVRLFQIAAWLDPAKTGRGALLGLVSLARNGEEEARFRAAAYLFDPRHDKVLLGQGQVAQPIQGKKENSPLLALLDALHLLRRGHGSQARAAVASPAVSDELDAHHGILSREEFLAACSAKELSDEQLRKVLDLELALDNRLHGRSDQAVATTLASWGDSIRSGSLSPLATVQFDKLTPFDPHDCIFRDGKWQRPETTPTSSKRK